MRFFLRVGRRALGNSPAEIQATLERALTPRDKDEGRLSVYAASSSAEAELLAVLHAAHFQDDKPANVDYIVIAEEGLPIPPDKSEQGVVPELRAAHHEIPNLDDADYRSRLAAAIVHGNHIASYRTKKADAVIVLNRRLEADPTLAEHFSDAWRT